MTWVELANADPCPCLALVFRGAGTRPAICCWSQCAAPVFSSVFSTCHQEPWNLVCQLSPIVFLQLSLSCLPVFSPIVSPLEPWNILEPCLPLCLPAVSQLSPDHIPIVSLLFPKCISGASRSSHVCFTLVFQLYPIVFLLSPHCLPVISPPFPTSIPLVSVCPHLDFHFVSHFVSCFVSHFVSHCASHCVFH